VPSMSVSSGACSGHTVVALSGELDMACGPWLSGSLAAITTPGSQIIMNVADLDFLDCGGLHALIAARRQALQAGGDLRLAGARQAVHRILALVDATGLLPAFASVSEAADGSAAPPGAASEAGAADWAGMTGPAQPVRRGAATS
jgi:anti-anti-sigma factor